MCALLLRPQLAIVPAPDDDDECGAVGGMLARGNQNIRRKFAPTPLCPPQIPHNLTRARTRNPETNRLSYGPAVQAP
jgi:hypothetical protein